MKKVALRITVMALCASLAFMPAGALDFTLEIFGNANMDGEIDEEDIALLAGIIKGTESPTRLADANNDGNIDDKDIAQVEMIIRGDESEIVVNDALNRTVTVNRPVERVMPLRLAISEAMVAMGAEDKVVGVASDTAEQQVLFPDLSQLPLVGKSSLRNADLEMIISLNPDLVLVNEYDDPEQIETLEAAGITVVSTECHGNLLNSISAAKRLGYILDAVDGAEEYTSWYGGYLDMISSRVEGLSEDQRPRVFYYWNWGEEDGPMGTSGQNCQVSTLIGFAGGRDIASDMPGEYIEVDPEWVIEQNPSLVVRELLYDEAGYDVTGTAGAEDRIRSFEERSGFEHIDAVNNGDVHIMAVNILSDNSWIGTVYLAKLIQSDLFSDLDPMAVHQEYLDRFLNLDYDIYERGLFIYPVPEERQ